MRNKIFYVVFPFIISYVYGGTAADDESVDISHGFGSRIKWQPSLNDGLRVAKATNRPLMVIIHKTWCGACRSLKPKFANSDMILKHSENFVMVNLEDDEEPSDNKFAPDGGYIPRILFLSPDGELIREVYNKDGSEQYKHFYTTPTEIVTGMKEAHTIMARRSTAEL